MPSTNPELAELVRRYRDNRLEYRVSLNETQLRREFIDPLLEILGWDIANRRGYAEAYKSVVHEDQLTIEGRSKAPDYSFRIGTQRKFFLEAKRPSVAVTTDADPAYQLRRYGWNGKLPFSILTNFETFAVYDCRIKPLRGDRASVARVLSVGFDEYLERWDEISSVFSFDAVMRGAYDRFATDRKPRRGTTTVDEAFLVEIERWRDVLAKAIHRQNRELSRYQLNEVVQLIIDRLIFLRIAEDLGIEPMNSLKEISERSGIYTALNEYFLQADRRYNSGLFHFNSEPDTPSDADTLTPSLRISDAALRDIISHLYPPLSDYEFKVIPADILGQIYEKFLGRTIRIEGSSVVIEDKPEVKKAGGVFYTPSYVVRYIVTATLDPLFINKTVAQVTGAQPIRILDPACGSGSFLIEVYQYLLDWYLRAYIESGAESHGRGRNPRLFRGASGFQLTIMERKRILLTHIFGVDIDPQAVEVTKMSLLLKVLKEESSDALASQMNIFQQRVLPDLDGNIKCGNSLIQNDFFGLFSEQALSEEELHKINVFSWNRRFTGAMREGFNAIVGNPPYGALFLDQEKTYFQTTYRNQNYQAESYLLFLEKSLSSLLSSTGRLGMIIPNPWLTNLLQRNLRQFVLETANIEQVLHFTFQVFKRAKATVDTEVVILSKGPVAVNPVAYVVDHVSSDDTIHSAEARRIDHDQKEWMASNGDPINIFLNADERALSRRLLAVGAPLATHFYTAVGMKPYQKGKGVPRQTKEDVEGRIFDADSALSPEHRSYLRGSDISRFWCDPSPSTYIRYGEWLAEPRQSARFDAEVKVLVRQTGDSLIAAVDTGRHLAMNNLHVLVPRSGADTAWFTLGILNSRLMNWCYQCLNPEMGEGLAEVKKANVDKLPLPVASARQRQTIIDLAQELTRIVASVLDAATQRQREMLNEQLNSATDRLNEQVYGLFSVTSSERQIIEAAQSSHRLLGGHISLL